MAFSLRAPSLIALTCALLGLVGLAGCSATAGADGNEDGTDEGALIPAKLFSVSCTVLVPAADGTVGTGKVSGHFRVGQDGSLTAADSAPVHFQLPDKDDDTVRLRSGRVIDAENDVFDLAVAYGLFTVGVHYDGSKKLENKGNVVLDIPIKGKKTLDGKCTFKDEAGNAADGKVAPAS